jgi:hypothetical protein
VGRSANAPLLIPRVSLANRFANWIILSVTKLSGG